MEDRKIHSTKDYSKFHFFDFNRKVNDGKVKKLASKIAENDLTKEFPIVVTKGFGVVDGQHRLKACESLGKPIYYVIAEKFLPSDVIDINTTQTKWTYENYLNFYLHEGFPEYVRYKQLCDTLFLSRLEGQTIFIYGSSRRKDDFRKGVFEISEASIIFAQKYVKLREKLTDFLHGEKKSILRCRSFINALMTVYKLLPRRIEDLFEQILKHNHLLMRYGDSQGYIRFFESLLNKKKRIENHVIFQFQTATQSWKIKGQSRELGALESNAEALEA